MVDNADVHDRLGARNKALFADPILRTDQDEGLGIGEGNERSDKQEHENLAGELFLFKSATGIPQPHRTTQITKNPHICPNQMDSTFIYKPYNKGYIAVG